VLIGNNPWLANTDDMLTGTQIPLEFGGDGRCSIGSISMSKSLINCSHVH
jgi:hypothetical protein